MAGNPYETLRAVVENSLSFFKIPKDELESYKEDLPEGWSILEGSRSAVIYNEALSDEEINRLKKLLQLEDQGINPYGERYEVTASLEEFKESNAHLESGQVGEGTYRLAGRIMAKRVHGKATFVDIEDAHTRLQLFLSRSETEGYDIAKKLLDVGDWVGVEGTPMRTKRGELSLRVTRWKLLSKCLKPLPEKWHGLRDQELRYRQRYLDFIVNKDSREKMFKRSRMIRFIRRYLEDRGFIEVETPILSVMATGALARPFITHHNALDIDLYLRIAPELYLKRLIVGHFMKVFEIGRVFRNEGISTKHNPEFTILELYQAFADLNDMMAIAEDMIYELTMYLNGKPYISWAGKEIKVKPPFKRLPFAEGLMSYGNVSLNKLREDEAYREEIAERWGVEWNGNLAHFMDKVFEAVVEPHLVEPTFVTDFPIELSPLAKRKDDDPSLTYRFELFIANFEVANAFSELNDPDDQAKRFLYQLQLKRLGDEEAHGMDLDYIEALKYSLPPTGGMGFGVDRLAMLFTDSQSIRDVIAFPLLRPTYEQVPKVIAQTKQG